MATTIIEQARCDTRLPLEQKRFFEKAAMLGGYRNLTDFLIQAAQDKAKEIIKERELVIASGRDSEIFFDEITNPKSPNEFLRKAVEKYNSQLSE